TGALYYPGKNVWKPLPTDAAPSARFGHTAVWTGKEMIVWGGNDGTTQAIDGASYNPTTDAWTSDAGPTALIIGREDHSAVWSDTITHPSTIVFGGYGIDAAMMSDFQADGAYYDLTSWGPI